MDLFPSSPGVDKFSPFHSKGFMRSLRVILPSILILIVTFAALAPCLQNGFVNFDDDNYVTENAVIRNFSLHNIFQIFSSFFVGTYLPVTMLSYMFDYQLVRLDPFGYHLTNLVFHLLNCLLVFWLIGLFSRNILVAFITAILFGIHPLHVEPVAWISARKDVLYSFFFLLSMICYCYYLRAQKTGKAYWFSVVFFVFSLLSKAMAITLPLLLLLMDYFEERRRDRKMITDKIPFLALAFGFGALGIFGQLPGIQNEHLLSFDRFLVPPYAVIFYLGKILWPVKLACVYFYSGIKDSSIYLLSMTGCLAILFLTIRSAKHTRKIVFGVLFFLIALLPVLRFVPMGLIIVADRYMYMASIGIFFLIAEGIVWAYKKTAEKGRRFGAVLVAVSLIPIIGSLVILTRHQSSIWKDGMTLWSDTLSKYPGCVVAYNNRGKLWEAQKEFEKARRDFKQAILCAPQHDVPYANLSDLYLEEGKTADAIAVWKKKLKLAPHSVIAYFQLGSIYEMLGKNDEAIIAYRKMLEFDPKNVTARYSLGRLYIKLGKKDDAVQMLSQTIEIAPSFLLAYAALSQLYEDAGKKAEQFALYRQAVARGVPFYEAYYVAGSFYQDTGQPREAIPLFQKAIELNATSAEVHAGLGAAYCAIGKNKNAIIWLKKALAIDPKLAVAHNNIAVAYYYQKQYDLAIRHCDKAMELGYKAPPKLLELLKPFRK